LSVLTYIDQNVILYFNISTRFQTQMSTDNQLRKHTGILTLFALSD